MKYRGEKPIVKNDQDDQIQWNGAPVILVNELSASASEIFAVAMQDYNRAVIIMKSDLWKGNSAKYFTY